MNPQHNADFLGKERLFPLLIRMSLPAAVAMIINALYNIVDTIFVGQGVGPLAIAALAIAFPIQIIVSSFAQAIGVGSASIASRRLGEKRPESAVQVAGTAYASVLVITIYLVVLVVALMDPILRLFGATEGILPFAREYLSYVVGGFFFFSLSMCMSTLIRAEGHARISMTGMIVGAVLNMILDPVFIFGFHTGVKGAAIATVISQMAACTYFFSFYLRKRSFIRISRKDLRISFGCLKEISALGIPAFVQSAGMSLLALVINNTLGRYGGDEAIAIYGMVHRLISLIIFPVLGVAQGLQPIAGYSYGARDFHRVRTGLITAILTAFTVSLFGFLIMELFPQLCVRMFTSDEALCVSGTPVIRIMGMFIPLAAVQITGSTFFQSIGKPKESFILGLSRQFLILIPIVLVLPRIMGVSGIWYAFPLADFISATLTIGLLLQEMRLPHWRGTCSVTVEKGRTEAL